MPTTLLPRLFLAALIACAVLFSPSLPFPAHAGENGLSLTGADPSAVQGLVEIYGVADHPTFRKWQLDLLLEAGDAQFLALGEEPVATEGLLASLDSRHYPDGAHRLRLRVVHSNLNYDEYFLPVRFANQPGAQGEAAAQPAGAARPPAPGPRTNPAPALSLLGNGLSVTGQGGQLSVFGIATHPTFRKWQLDLLLGGDAQQAVFLAMSEEPIPVAAPLATVESAAFPPGAHQLRLRVVHSNLNYDEYFLPLAIGPGLAPAGRPSRLVARASDAGKAVYLTFDDGPHPINTPQILEVLAEYDAKATFFVVGSLAQGRGELLKSIYDGGHAIGNHTWGHRKLGGADWEIFEREVGATARVLGGYGSRCLRPPYGDVGPNLYANAQEAGYTIVYWSVDSLDWKRQNPERIAEEVLGHVYPGAIVLFHDGGGSRAGTVEALRTILAALTAEGYTFPALCR